MHYRAEKNYSKKMFSAFLNNFMVRRHCWIIFCIYLMKEIRALKIHHERNRNLIECGHVPNTKYLV